MSIVTLSRRLVAFAAGSFLLLPVPAFAEGEDVTSVTLAPAPTLVAPTLTVPSTGSSTSGGLTVPTITVPQLQVPTLVAPTLSVPQLQVPTITVPQLQVPSLTVPSLQVPEVPTITVPQTLEVTSSPQASAPNRSRDRQGAATSSPAGVTPQVTGLISPEMLLEMLRVQEAETNVELVAPQEATSTNRLPIGTFAAFGGGVAMVSFALSLLRRRATPVVEA